MRPLLLCAGVATLLVAAVPAFAADQTILPGYWESQNKVAFPLNDESTSRQCITAAQVAQFLSGPSTRHYKCTYEQSQISGGAITAQGHCVDKNGLTSRISVNGTYAPEHFKLKADLTVSLGGLPIPVKASTEATRLSAECPAKGG